MLFKTSRFATKILRSPRLTPAVRVSSILCICGACSPVYSVPDDLSATLKRFEKHPRCACANNCIEQEKI